MDAGNDPHLPGVRGDVVTERLVDKYGEAEVRAMLGDLHDPEQARIVLAALEAELAEWIPLEHQKPSLVPWSVWLLMGGRGTGKTDSGAHAMNEHMEGPPCDPRLPGGHRASIVGPTLGDAAESCVNGPSGLKAHNPQVTMASTIGGTVVRWPNGAEAKLFGGWTEADVERFRAGGNRCYCWIEEAAAIPQLPKVWEQIPPGHRLGRNPRVVASTTPKPRQLFKTWKAQAQAWKEGAFTLDTSRWQRIFVTEGTTFDNPFLEEDVRQGLADLYGGTRFALQELMGQLLDDFEGALWNREMLDRDRAWLAATVPTLTRIAIGVDPSTWGPEMGIAHETVGRGIETGIIVAGIDARTPPHVYVLADLSGRYTVNEWAQRVRSAWHDLQANVVAVEKNVGGWVGSILASVDPQMHLDGVMARQGKRIRAEQIIGLYEQERVHHVGSLMLLEDQMCGWDPKENWSPDRLDALVHAVSALNPWYGAMVGSTAS